jgi:RND family efflux transporter MFP subunit
MTSRTRTVFLLIAVAMAVTLGGTAYLYRGRSLPIQSSPAATSAPVSVAQAGDTPRAAVDIDARRQQLIGVRTVTVRRAPLSHTVRTVGVVKYDETRQADINLKVEGYIRDLYADYTGQPIRKGQPLFTIYSPELLSTQNEFLLALKTRDQLSQSQIADARERADALVGAARQRLALWDVPADDIATLERTHEPVAAVVFHSPAAGFIVEKQAVAGMHVMPGQTLYKVADTSVVWVEAEVYESEVSLVKVGQAASVTLDAYPDQKYLGRVVYIYPYVDEQSRTNKVRYSFANTTGRLKPGMYANVDLDVAHGDGIVVPANAVLDSGREQIVFVAQGEGHFEPRHVKLGRRSGEDVEILDGVKEGEQVAAAAAFFLDSESQLRGSLQGFQPPTASTASAAASQPQLSIAFRSIPDPPKAGENQFEATVKGADGKAIDDADVTVQFFMAAMPTMNMPAMKSDVTLSPAGGGVYRGTGQIMTPGRWDTTITVTKGGQRLGSKQTTVIGQ